ncbi:Crp/Fnr family transcriptional regulator [Listeria ivanovii subsp. londoniensis]|uniref:Crp/Fnr family transcriptional regulator n=1 Tax=Listeria ivanovii TaxID=1638 RepID=UPI001902FA28|nr:Crp/Fnr family transcriptional regulator [Listeria ivanovii]MBK2003188.1 Crp/Fnr family transcriptional regulator [Listeria ivanovii subsp. londoniensis]
MLYIKDILDVISHEYSNRISFSKGDIIHSFGVDIGSKTQMGIIMSGAATVEGHTSEGRWLINGLVAESMLFGLEVLLETSTTPKLIDYRVRALTDGSAILINRELFLNYLYANPQVFHQILDNVLVKYMFTAKNYKNINQSPFYKAANVLVEIVELLNLHQHDSQITLPSYVTQSLLADYCRSSRARITEVLETMREKGLLTSKKPITISSFQNLQNLIENF